MIRIRSNIWLKSLAAILAVLMIIVLSLSTLGVILCGVMEVYSDPDGFKDEMYGEIAYYETNKVQEFLYLHDHETLQTQQLDIPDSLKVENTNLRFSVVDADGNDVLANAEIDKKKAYTGYTVLEFSRDHHTESRSYYQIEDANEFFEEFDGDTKRIITYNWSSGIDEEGRTLHILTIEWEEVIQEEYTIYYKLTDPLRVKDEIYVFANMLEVFTSIRWVFAITVPSALILLLLLVIYLCTAAGYRKNSLQPTPNWMDRIPTDIYLLFWGGIVGSIIILGIYCFEVIFDIDNPDLTVILFAGFGLGVLLIASMLLALVVSIANRIKCRTIISNTIVWRVLRLFGKAIRAIGRFILFYVQNLKLYWKAAIAIVFLIGLEVIVLFSNSVGFIAVGVILANIILIPIAIYCIVQYQKLTESAKRLALGETSFQIDTSGMILDLKTHGEALNGIGLGMQNAVEERIKSERFKTELITNVSHDIKTPVTSIINYVDLLKKENIQSQSAKDYIDVLDRQSSRLKKLIEDLVEASKASTGNLTVHTESIDLNMLIAQTTAEFYQKLDSKELTVVSDLAADQNCIVLADGRLLWRVLENLMSNVCKYAQEKTRLYISTEICSETIKLVLKNTSKYALNISSEELMERFTRGDASRHTEGSGLGLSIAQSLVELQKGSFEVVIDGDLFKVIIELPKQ